MDRRPRTGDEVVDAVLAAAHRFRRTMDKGLRAGGLSLPTYRMLRELSAGERSMRELSDVLKVTPRTVTDMVDGLQGRGQVERCPHPHDRRVTLIRLTEAGTEALRQIRAEADRIRDTAIAGIDSAQRAVLLDLLERIAPASDCSDRKGDSVDHG